MTAAGSGFLGRGTAAKAPLKGAVAEQLSVVRVATPWMRLESGGFQRQEGSQATISHRGPYDRQELGLMVAALADSVQRIRVM